MKKTTLFLLGVLVISLFLVSCAEEISDGELEATVAEMSDQELQDAANEVETAQEGTLVGQALKVRGVTPTGVSRDRFAKVVYKEQLKRTEIVPEEPVVEKDPEILGVKPLCTETDGGDDISIVGKLNAKYGYAQIFAIDNCKNNYQLFEYFCTELKELEGSPWRVKTYDCTDPQYGGPRFVCKDASCQVGKCPEGLVNWWPADNNPDDEWSMKEGVAEKIGVPYPDGIAGKAFNLKGWSRVVAKNTNSMSLNREDFFTIEAWIKTKDNVGGPIVSKYSESDKKGYELGMLGNGQIVFFLSAADSDGRRLEKRTFQTGYNDNKWHHVAVTFAPEGVSYGVYCPVQKDFLKVYVDGIPVKTTTPQGKDRLCNPPLDTSNGWDIVIGGRYDNSKYFTGLIDDAAIYNRALSATEIKEHFKRKMMCS